MAYPKVKGNIVLKLLIVILAGVLAFAIYYPNHIWTIEQKEEDECRFRLISLLDAQAQYYAINDVYADSIEKIISLAEVNVEYRTTIDSLIQILSRQDSTDRVKMSKPLRPYQYTTVTIDSIFICPASGEYFVFSSDDPLKYTITCPVEPDTLIKYKFFKRIFRNHGSVNQNKETSW